MAIDQEAIKKHVRGIIEAIGENPDREGLVETPDRVARMYAEVFEGINYTNREIAEMFCKTFDVEKPEADAADAACRDMVIVKDIDIFSYCEHHMALMYDMQATVAYLPKERVIGLSKIARICEMASKRLQLQERLGADIAEIMELATGSEDIAVYITGSHSCMTARGIKKPASKTVTQTFRGRFKTDAALLNRFLLAVK